MDRRNAAFPHAAGGARLDSKSERRIAPLAWLVVLGVAGLSIVPTRGNAADLVVRPVDRASLTALAEPRAAWASAANDLGEVAGEAELSHLTLVLRRSPDRQSAFEELLRQQQDPGSPNYHRWLTPVQVGERFGASANDIDAVTGWLRSQGLRVDNIANGRTRIGFSGSAAAVGVAFASRLHVFHVNGEQRIAPADVPRIPAALAAIVQAVHGLVTIPDRPYHTAGAVRVASRIASEAPDATFCPSSPCAHYLWPGDFAAIYDLNAVHQQGIDGTGQTIALLGRSRVYLPDVENFQMLSNLPIKDPVVVVPPGGIDPGTAVSSGPLPGDQVEATLDVTRSGSVAPGATILLVVSADSMTVSGLGVAAQYVVDTQPVPAQVMNISFGACEAVAGSAGVHFWDSVFAQAAAEGISVTVSSGDSGAARCDSSSGPPPAMQFPSPSYICASSYATCVGGTEFADMANPAAYWSANNGPGFESALVYIPEGGWNDPLDSKGNPHANASTGGVSSYIATPSWQVGPGVPGTQGRYTPDVSFTASAVHDGYLLCLAATGASCVVNGAGQFHFGIYGGTSATAPTMAGVVALLNQKMGVPQGNLNPRLYALAAVPGNGVFHDVTVATSGVAGCDVSVPSMCNNSTPGPTGLDGGLAGYLVGPGYDLVTGLGSIDIANLLAQWPAAPPGAMLAVEYYYAAWNFYFVTAFPDEIAGLDAGAYGGVWKRTGQTFYVWPSADSSPWAVPTCRFFTVFFAPKSSHFYTPNADECQGLIDTSQVWQFESIAFYIALVEADGSCPAGTIPLYRAYNNGMGGAPNHRFVTSLAILNQMIAAGWVFEGNLVTKVFACVPVGTVLPGATAEGLWAGPTSTGELILGIVLDDGTFYLVYSSSTDAGMIAGTVTYANGQFSSADALDINFAGLGVRHPAVSGNYVSQASLNGSIITGAQAATFALSYDPDYTQPASLSVAAGTYSGYAATSQSESNATFTLGANGAFSGSASGCSFAGTLSPHGSVSVFDFTVTFQGGPCSLGTATVIGVGFYDAPSRELLAMGLNAARTDGFLAIGTRQ